MLALNRAEDDGTRVPLLAEMAEQVRSVAARAGIAGFGRAAQLGSSLGSLMAELRDKPKNIHVSTLRTLATALDLLDVMTKSASSQTEEVSLSAQALVVDDEAICRRTLCTALTRAGLKHVSLDRPELALAVAEQNRFDLVFLDVNMPGMNGFELATKLRALPTNAGTPLIFVTTLSDFKSRAQSTLSGGNDFIVKPFPLIELAVKALTYLLKPVHAPKVSPALAA
jgi:two-component system chemotaxis response regulator CheY